MIEDALKYLAHIMSERISSESGLEHKFKEIYTDVSNGSTSIGDHKSLKITGYIRPTDISVDVENRKQRNLQVVVQSNDASHTMDLVPVKVECQVKISLYKGHPQFYKVLPSILRLLTQGSCNFTLHLTLGEEQLAVPVQVKGEPSIQFPEIEVDVDQGEAPLLFTLNLSNLFTILGSHSVPRIITLDSKSKVQS